MSSTVTRGPAVSPSRAPAPAEALADARRRALLDAALTVFLRYGFRKTSMDDVARAADISRQGLYLHFPTKEDLFRAATRHALEGALRAAGDVLAERARPLEARLVGAFDQWVGRWVAVL